MRILILMNNPALRWIFFISDSYFPVTSLNDMAATDSIPSQFSTKSNLIQHDLVGPIAAGYLIFYRPTEAVK